MCTKKGSKLVEIVSAEGIKLNDQQRRQMQHKFKLYMEKYIVATESGKDVVNAARRQVAKQHSIDNIPYFEEELKAKVIHQMYEIEAENDFWMHAMVFNRELTDSV